MTEKPLALGSWESSHTNQQVRVFVSRSVLRYTVSHIYPKRDMFFGNSYLLIWIIEYIVHLKT